MQANLEELEREECKLQALRAAVPEEVAAALAQRQEALAELARLGVEADMGRPDAEAASRARAALAEAEEQVLVNGRRARALEDAWQKAEAALAKARAAKARAERSAWEPGLRAALPAIEEAALAAIHRLVAARSMLDGTPPGRISADVLVKRLAYGRPLASVEEARKRLVEEHTRPAATASGQLRGAPGNATGIGSLTVGQEAK